VQSTPRSVVIRSTSGVFEPRFVSAIKLLSEFNSDVSTITWSRTVSECHIVDPGSPWVFKAQADYGGGFKNYVSHLKFMLYTYSSLKEINPDLIYACDLDTLIPSLAWRWGRGKSQLIVFDQFDPLSIKTRNPILSRLLHKLELILTKKANFRITPNIDRINPDYASEWIESKNLFEFENSEIVANSTSSYLQLFYGGILSMDRGLIALSSAVTTLPRWELQIFGQGPELIRLKSLNNPRVITRGLLDHKLLMKEAQKADLYTALYDPKFNHNKKTASNKLFEAAQLGIPLLATKNTYLGEIVEKHRLGWTVYYDDIQGIMGALTSYEKMELREKSEIKKNLQDYFKDQLTAKRESLNRLSSEIKRALGTR